MNLWLAGIARRKTKLSRRRGRRQHAALGLVHGFVDLIETLDGKKQMVDAIHFYRSAQNFIEAEVPYLAASLEHITAFALRTDHAAAVHFQPPIFSNQAKFHRVPEKPSQAFQGFLVLNPRANAAVVLQEIREHSMRVHRNMAEDIVKNIGLRSVFERVAAPRLRGGGKHARRQHLEKSVARKKTANRRCAPSRARFQSRADRGEIGKPVVLQSDDFIPFKVGSAREAFDLRAPTPDEFRPHSMLFRRVFVISLLDQIGRRGRELHRAVSITSSDPRDVRPRRPGLWQSAFQPCAHRYSPIAPESAGRSSGSSHFSDYSSGHHATSAGSAAFCMKDRTCFRRRCKYFLHKRNAVPPRARWRVPRAAFPAAWRPDRAI